MKKPLFMVFMALPLASLPLAPDTIEREFAAAPGKKLEMDLNAGGSIQIQGWEKERIAVRVYGAGSDLRYCKVEFDERASGLYIHSYYSGRQENYSSDLRFEISVPASFDLDLESMGGGIAIQNVAGEIHGKTMGGELNLKALKGKLELTTMGGAISLTGSDVDGKVKTMGGDVLVQDVKGDVKASSQGGNVVYKNVTRRTGNSTAEELKITSMGGDINVDEAPAGADVHTMGGDVHIRDAHEFAKAKTMGGNIEIDAVDGWVDATTMGGDVTVHMVGDPEKGNRDVEIQSMSGDVTLTVPAALSMDFEITLAYTNNSRMNYKISSDFPLNQEHSPEWDRSRGTPRKYVYGKGSVSGGRNKIRISTVNGNILLRKG